jgi:hypothetical protein
MRLLLRKSAQEKSIRERESRGTTLDFTSDGQNRGLATHSMLLMLNRYLLTAEGFAQLWLCPLCTRQKQAADPCVLTQPPLYLLCHAHWTVAAGKNVTSSFLGHTPKMCGFQALILSCSQLIFLNGRGWLHALPSPTLTCNHSSKASSRPQACTMHTELARIYSGSDCRAVTLSVLTTIV